MSKTRLGWHQHPTAIFCINTVIWPVMGLSSLPSGMEPSLRSLFFPSPTSDTSAEVGETQHQAPKYCKQMDGTKSTATRQTHKCSDEGMPDEREYKSVQWSQHHAAATRAVWGSEQSKACQEKECLIFLEKWGKQTTTEYPFGTLPPNQSSKFS